MKKSYILWVVLLIINLADHINTKFTDKLEIEDPVDDPLVITTSYGSVRGFYINSTRAFWGIPYAMPPTSNFRWEEPLRPLPWLPEVLDATKPPKACIQAESDQEQDENCLYLNIYTPATDVLTEPKLPVIVIFHGGSFNSNSNMGGKTDGRFLAAQGAVVVNPNFRLGALGFLVTKSKEINGNYGIMDQRMVLEFVQENIAYFGGDPERVTIMGPSSGAQSAAIHLTSQRSDELFSQAILLDDPFTMAYHQINSERSLSVGSIFSKYLNCGSTDTKCMRSRSAAKVRSAQAKTDAEVLSNLDLADGIYDAEVWNPVIDGVNVEENPLDAIQQPGRLMTKPVIIGSNKDDWRLLLAAFGNATLSMENYFKILLVIYKADATKVVAKYPPTPLGDNGDQFATVATHYLVTCSNRLFARKSENDQGVYHYIYSIPTQAGMYPDTIPKCVNYACHNAATIQEFGTFSLNDISPTEEIKRSSDSMLYYWLNFVHTGDPNNNTWSSKECLECYTQWPRYDSSSGWQSMDFKLLSNEIVDDYNKYYCDFWDSLGYIKESKDIKSAKCQTREPDNL